MPQKEINLSDFPPLLIKDLSFSYDKKPILKGLSLNLQVGSSVAIVGSSGSGKSTLLSLILGLLTPQSGSIEIAGTSMKPGLSSQSARLRREHIGMVFQQGYLLEELTARENVIIPALAAGHPSSQAVQKADDLLNSLGLPEVTRPVGSYSGGEQQRIAIARALINSPSLLIADEPTASLDPETRDAVIQLLLEQTQEHHCAVLLVTHDMGVASSADHILRLNEGTLQEEKEA